MGSTFSNYQIPVSGMRVNQTSLFVTGHNISNVNTPGYVRQQAMLSEHRPQTIGRYKVGIGADVDQIRQIRNGFLDKMYRNENHSLGYWTAKSTAATDVQEIMGEISDNGFKTALNQFFEGWQELCKSPASLTIREHVKQTATAFTNIANHMGQRLDELQQHMNKQVRTTVDEINSIIKNISQLNEKVLRYESGGDEANDYRDQRNVLIDRLSGLVNIDITEVQNGTVNLSIGGKYLVHGSEIEKIKADFNKPGSFMLTAKWESDNELVDIVSGRIKGIMDARGNVSGYKGSIENGSPAESGYNEDEVDSDAESEDFKFDAGSENFVSKVRKGFNNMMNLVCRKINAIHRKGIGLDGSTGVDFFTKIDKDLPFELGNIKVNEELNDINKIAASADGDWENSEIAHQISDFRREKYFQYKNSKETIDDYYASFVGWVGTIGREAGNMVNHENVMCNQIQNKKDSVSGVSLDEEMSSMLKFQHGYNASARMLNIVDEMISTIINRMGIVGR